MRKVFSLFTVVLLSLSLSAKEGMWLPHLIAQLNYSDMQRMGLQISAEEIYAVNKSSLKDAVVHFNGGCTGELISSQGLLLTNHHCGYSQIQSHSSLENNYLEDGFWARSQQEELANPGLYAAIIREIKDVTNDMLMGTTAEMSERERDSIIRLNGGTLLATMQAQNPSLEYELKDFFFGNQYLLISKVKYTDVRLVGAPPSSIGKYGKDTDNWMWPRHTGDFSLFRVYANANNEPAEYATDNVPYQPAQHLKINIAGIKEGDFTMVYGFPGSTNQYLPASEVAHTVNDYNPFRISIRDRILQILDQKMRSDEEASLKYASKFARISNSWKRWKGEILGIERTNALQVLRDEEALFKQMCEAIPELNKDKDLVADLDELYAKRLPIYRERYAYIEVGYYGIEAFRHVLAYAKLIKLAKEAEASDNSEALQEEAERLARRMTNFLKDYDYDLDRRVAINILPIYLKTVETEIGPQVEDLKNEGWEEWPEEITELFEEAPYFEEEFIADLKSDPLKMAEKIAEDDLYLLSREMYDHFFEVLNAKTAAINLEIDALQARYVSALQRAFPKKSFYPDANSTLRVGYGQVKSYEARDAVHYEAQTHLKGVIEKYIPGDYEFDLPQKLIDLYEAKDYGPYGENGRMPVCFVATNHTTGGNSGSPVLNARGELIGLNFDRAWDGVMSDMYFDPSICRNVMVDLRYVLFIIDKLGGASYLVDEMDLVTVHPDELKKAKSEEESIRPNPVIEEQGQ